MYNIENIFVIIKIKFIHSQRKFDNNLCTQSILLIVIFYFFNHSGREHKNNTLYQIESTKTTL
jgi:hypothetical protein